MKPVILAGNAMTAEILLQYLAMDQRYQVVALTVDDDYVAESRLAALDSIPLSQLATQFDPKEYSVMMAMGYHDLNQTRASMFVRLKQMGYSIEAYIHPDAKVYTHYPIGEGSIVLPCSVIEPHAKVAENCFIGANVTIAHHARVDQHCWVASGAVVSGQAEIGKHVFLGVNATVVNEVCVGDDCIVGASALISKHIKPATVHLARSGEMLRYSSQDYVKFFGV